jgi:non-specific serine/threonine protein kinase
VHFNLAENRGDEEAPFAFIATYTTRLSSQGRAPHLPLAEALRGTRVPATRRRFPCCSLSSAEPRRAGNV